VTTPTERLAALAEEIAEAERLITKFSAKPPSRFFTRIVERSRENLAAAEREKAALEGVLASRRRREAQEVQGPQRAAAAAARLRELIIEHKGPARIRVWTKKRVGTRLYFPGDAGYLVFGWDGGVSSMDRGRQTLAWGALYPRWRKAVRAAIEVYRDENTERIEADIAAQRGRPSRQRRQTRRGRAARPLPCNIVPMSEESEVYGWYALFHLTGIRIAGHEEPLFACVDKDGEPLGVAVGGLAPIGDYAFPAEFRFSVAVDPDHHRKGIARALVRRLKDYYLASRAELAEAYGVPWVEMVAWVVNPHMAVLLEDEGFDTAGREWTEDTPHMRWSG
jgi:GNAT superfamily N-acetyltransferase